MNRARRIATALLACALLSSAAPRIARASTRTVVDEVGRRVEIPARVTRIVTLAPNLTETIYALGLADRLAGDTNFCDTPEAAKSKPHVGNPQNPSLEAIVGLHPDLVLATTSINRVETADALARLGIAVYTTDAHTVRTLLSSITDLADVAGAPQQGHDLVAQLQSRLDAIRAKLANRPMAHVLFVVWMQPLISIGPGTFVADALRSAGAESIITSDHPWPQLSVEEVVRLQPDYIVFVADHGDTVIAPQDGSAAELADLRANPAWKQLEAVQLGRVLDVSDEIIRPSPGLIGVIEELAREVHPEAFPAQAQRFDARCVACVL